MKKHLNIRVCGNVEGVGFRGSARLKAQSLDLKGFVRNEPDGSVYIEAEGEELNLQKFLDWCRKGPSFAKVQEVSFEESLVKNYKQFVILVV